MTDGPSLDLDEVRRRLEEAGGRSYWRCLEEVAETDDFRRFVAAEFPSVASDLRDGAWSEASRRDFLRVMAASMMLGGLAACGDQSDDRAVPYVMQPETMTAGVPRYYATAVPFEGYGQPVLATTHVGRPTKLEGNAEHPVSRGASDAFTQAAILQLYDPDRSQAIRYQGTVSGWGVFLAAMVSLRAQLQAAEGAGLRILTGTVTSPTTARQIEAVVDAFPGSRWHSFEPVGLQARHEGTRRAFGRPLDVQPSLDRAAVIVSFDDDVLGPGPAQVRNAADWSERRRATQQDGEITRLYVAESAPSLTGAVATKRLATPSSRMASLVQALAIRLGVASVEEEAQASEQDLGAAEREWVDRVAQEVEDRPRDTLVTVAATHPPELQALGHLINRALGSVGRTLVFTEPVARTAREDVGSLEELAADIAAGAVGALLVIDVNPIYAAPADLDFAALFDRVSMRLHAGLYYDETAARSHWHVPLAHPLESWGDVRAVDGLATILQPTVSPIFDGVQLHELLAVLLGRPDATAYDIVRESWREFFTGTGADPEPAWRQALEAGVVPGTAAEVVSAEPAASAVDLSALRRPVEGLEVIFRPDPSIWDGRFSNVSWLQELPKPLTKITWDNYVAVSPGLAHEFSLQNGDQVVIEVSGRSIAGPVWIMPGQAARTVTVFLGYGRPRAGRVGKDRGYDAYAIRTTENPWILAGAALARTGAHTDLATTQHHFTIEGRDMVRTMTLAEVRAPAGAPSEPELPSFYREWEYPDQAWAMVIDQDLCIGCNACVVACQAENNVPVVGREQVLNGREMHWLRVDRYYTGTLDDPEFHFQPVPCMHCEKAPCEVGCPVNATVHGPEGLNQMIYNRCVGTRTCASYCPYKVRRFNFFEYAHTDAPSIEAQRNPDVTVRARGVMEKCTYCVQRINAARIAAETEGRPIRDGEIKTACQEACPTQVIVFGDRNDPDSAVARRRQSPRNYELLHELNTKPRTTYLAAIDVRGSRAGRAERKGET